MLLPTYEVDACWEQNTILSFGTCVLLRVHLSTRVCSDAGPGLLLSSGV